MKSVNLILVFSIFVPLLLNSQIIHCEYNAPVFWMTNKIKEDIGDTLSINHFSKFLSSGDSIKSHPDFGQDSILPGYFFPCLILERSFLLEGILMKENIWRLLSLGSTKEIVR